MLAQIIAIAGVFVVAWQSYETRRTAKAAKDGIELARAEEQNSRALLAEAVRSRIDSMSPSIKVRAFLSDEPRIGPTPPTAVDRVPADHAFELGPFGPTFLAQSVTVVVYNDSDEHVSLAATHLASDAFDHITREVIVEPHKQRELGFVMVHSIEEWIDDEPMVTFGGRQLYAPFQLVYRSPRDTGVTELWTIDITHDLFAEARLDQAHKPVPLTFDNAAHSKCFVMNSKAQEEDVVVVTHERTYWLSQSRDQQLD